MSGETRWNGERCKAERVIVRVGRSEMPTWWCADLEGTERAAVIVHYGAGQFFLDDEDGSGWHKVTHGGSPRLASRSLPNSSIVLGRLEDLP